MRRITPKVLSIALVMSSVAYGQSLGDVARENREKQKAKSASSSPKPKVITNENLPARPEATPSEIDGEAKPASSAVPSDGMSAEEWKSQILAQKNAIAAQQAQIDKVNDSIHYVTASLYSNGLQYNDHQAKKQQSVEQMKQQLEEQKKNLAQMQDAARKAGMGSAVYDP